MGLTRRKDSLYVEFRVVDNGETLQLAPPGEGKLKRWKVGCRNKEEARKQEAILRTHLLQGLRYAANVQSPQISFGQYSQRWLESAKATLAPKTYANYDQLLRLYVLPALRDRSMHSLKWADIKRLLMEKQQAGLSVNTVRLIRATISTILTDAAEEGIIPVNPALGQRRKRRSGHTAVPEVNPMTWEQKKSFEETLEELEGTEALWPAYVMLLLVYLKTGVRPGEGRALMPGDIDFAGRRLRVERSATVDGKIKSTKTGETRWVDLSDGIVEDLRAYVTWLKAEQIAQGKEPGWLFPSKTGTLLDERHVVRAFHRVLEKAELPQFRVYDLRHTFASLLLSSNVPLLYVSQQLGHSKPTITLKYYARWIPSGQAHRVNVLDTANTVITPPVPTYVTSQSTSVVST